MSRMTKPRSVWVWASDLYGLATSDTTTNKPDDLLLKDDDVCGYVEFREVLPKKRKAVKRGK